MTAPIAARDTPIGRGQSRARLVRSLAIATVAAAAGFVAVSQVQGRTPAETSLLAETEEDLARILADLNTEADALQEEIGLLRLQLNELQRSSESAEAAARAREEQLRTLQVLAGTTPVTGSGVAVLISDPDRAVRYESLIDVVQELRDAGAEAIAVNDRRVGATSAFAQDGSRALLDGAPLSTPYRITAIGQPATLEGGLKIPGGAVDAMQALRVTVRVAVERHARVDIPALQRAPSFEVARPVGSTS